MRTIEALALAIEAKDHTTHTHLQRVRTYAIEVAKELSLREERDRGLARRGVAARYRKAGRSRTDHQQAGKAHARKNSKK